MKEFIDVMKALSDPSRVRLLKILQKKTLCVCEIQSMLGIAQPTVSKHMKIMEKAGLVKKTKDGLWVNYTVAYGSDNPYAASIIGNLQYWLSDDAVLKKMEKKLPHIQRKNICRKD